MTGYLRAVGDLWNEQAERDGHPNPGEVCVVPGDTPGEVVRNLVPEIGRRAHQPR